ncbi:hypothetical protein [Frankia sp. AvcI1]|uniref:hypothetical protein n=1 Tax=Frankia sp. AvcI1 TaxID=573496 RepID=UPI002117905C|nr:hypothetical protein [Frankia sp. AvcI1]
MFQKLPRARPAVILVAVLGFLLSATFVAVPAASAASKQLLKDGGFESQHSGSVSRPWGSEGPDSKGIDRGKGFSAAGDNNAWIRAASKDWNAITQSASVDRHHAYAISVKVRTSDNFATGVFGVRTKSGATIAETQFGPTGGRYIDLVVKFNSEDNTSVTVYSGFWAPGTDVWLQIDEVYLGAIEGAVHDVTDVSRNAYEAFAVNRGTWAEDYFWATVLHASPTFTRQCHVDTSLPRNSAQTCGANEARILDFANTAQRIAYEVKSGKVSKSQEVEPQATADGKLVAAYGFHVEWHFFPGQKDTLGPSKPLRDYLTDQGIDVIIHHYESDECDRQGNRGIIPAPAPAPDLGILPLPALPAPAPAGGGLVFIPAVYTAAAAGTNCNIA